MAIVLEPVSLGESTAISVRFFLGRALRARGRILVVKYDGICRTGDDGESDGRFMLAMGKAGLTAWEPDGLIIELSGLACEELVEGLNSLLYVGERVFGNVSLPQAAVVGPRSEQAIRPFFVKNNAGCEVEPTKEWSRDIASAMDYVEEEMAKLDLYFAPKARRPESP